MNRGHEMFEPNFRYTHPMVNNLVDIGVSRATVLSSRLVPKWDITLRREALVASAHASTAIEGNPLSLREVSLLAEGREVMATRRAKHEVINYLDVLRNLERYHTAGRMTEEHILRLHRDIAKGVLEDPDDEGHYRDVVVVVGDPRTGHITYRPPPPRDVPRLMREFTGWLGSDATRELDPVIAAGISHYEFVRIHPFVDGNGRTARALATVLLASREFDIKGYFALDDFFDADRASYYRALSNVDKHRRDLTTWLEYFTSGVLVSMSKVRERVLELSLERRRVATEGQLALTERQMSIVELAVRNGRVTSKDVASKYGISPQAAHKEIRGLVDLKVLQARGKGKATYYVPT